ncbi:GNAT family N-acetyltransferase [Actinomyces polynesiensis]|uniref:GNAT family N-acetyltransferase n=1 Tax=Actinomyces polynesiensis TaxID=1325934 RepID=UPI0005B82BEE|nr:GNAT family protein [Actinomyces polynesiensis]
MSSRWVPKPTLEGDLVVLRPFDVADVDVMARILADPEVLRLTGSVTSTEELHRASPLADDRTREWYASRAQVDGRLDLAVVDRASDTVVGEVVLNEFDPSSNSANFRTLMGPEGRGRGLGTEAARLILGHGFEVIGLHRIGLDVFAFNPRARHVYATVGFVMEGVKRDAFAFDGEYVDEIWMSILADEWQQHHGRPGTG